MTMTTLRTAGPRRLLLALIVALAALLGLTGPASAAGTTAPCYIAYGSQYLYIADNAFESCARIVQASGYSADYRYGYWGSYQMAVNSRGDTYYRANGRGNWQSYGVVANPDGSQGSLFDRCQAGDRAACDRYRQNADAHLSWWDLLYPSGWSR